LTKGLKSNSEGDDKKIMGDQSGKWKMIGKIIFWCLMPLFFAAFVRFYSAVFQLIYGIVFTAIFGDKAIGAVFIISLLTSIAFSVATCSFLWKQYKKHILEG
jgi:hypothetical protein